MINGKAHGPEKATATCQLHMRKFRDGDEIVIEPWRAESFPVLKDLMVDRRALDRIVEAGGYISAPTGTAPDANEILVPKEVADTAMDAAACIGCGACVAACPNSAAQLFTSAKLHHLNVLPQGQPERFARTEAMVETMEDFFGSCTNHGECEDLKSLATAVAPVAGSAPIIFVCAPAQAIAIRLWARNEFAYEVLSSNGFAEGMVMAIASNAIVSATDAVPEFRVGMHGVLVLQDDAVPAQLGENGVVGSPAKSLWQSDLIALWMRLKVAWALRNAGGLAWLENVSW